MVKADGFDDAIIGFCQKWGSDDFLIVYDAKKMIQILVVRDDMTHEEAFEYFEYNIQGAYVGENTPIYMWESTIEGIEEMAEHLDG